MYVARMQGDAMEIGRSYAYREKRGAGQPMLKVKLVDKVGRKGKLKVRFEDGPHPGLEEYIATRDVVCPWGQRTAVIRDEQRAERLEEDAAKASRQGSFGGGLCRLLLDGRAKRTRRRNGFSDA
jgi:hypothetical protein